MTNPKIPRGYTNEEAASILSRAMDRQYGEGRISHDELLETAREIGVSTSELEAAVIEETRIRAEKMVRDELQQRRISRFLRHLTTFVVVNAFCFVIDIKLTGGVWFYWVGLGWGIALGLHGARVFRAGREPEPATPAPPSIPTRIQVPVPPQDAQRARDD
jgi:hypothetical protein